MNQSSSTIDNLRSFKVTPINIALFDLVLALLGTGLIFVLVAVIYNKITKTTPPDNIYLILFFLGFFLAIPIGVISHKIFGINTALNYKLGISDAPEPPKSSKK
jgi:hypothetical protein